MTDSDIESAHDVIVQSYVHTHGRKIHTELPTRLRSRAVMSRAPCRTALP